MIAEAKRPTTGSYSPIFAGRVEVLAVRRDTREKRPFSADLIVGNVYESRRITPKLDAAELFDFDLFRLRMAQQFGVVLNPRDREEWAGKVYEAVERESKGRRTVHSGGQMADGETLAGQTGGRRS